jgi:hypothetical protein
VADVADDRDAGPVEAGAAVAAEREGVEQRLGGVFVAAVAGVDDRSVDRWRTTMASTPMASTVWTVSRRLSPLAIEEPPTLKAIVSAESRLAAVSNESRVRVDSS